MARARSREAARDVAVAVTGIAGPGGGTPAKPVGLVCFAWAAATGRSRRATAHFAGDRAAVRAATVAARWRA